ITVLGFRLRAGLLGLVAVPLVGSLMSAPASANPGPFCYHRTVGSEGKGEKIKAETPEGFRGEGELQKIKSKLAGLAIQINGEHVQVKGILYNNALQCQTKLESAAQEAKLDEPKIAGCVVKRGENNIVKGDSHVSWKWDGTKTQLEEQPQKNQE